MTDANQNDNLDADGNKKEPQIDIHLDLDEIKRAKNFESDIQNKSLLALTLVLLKQV